MIEVPDELVDLNHPLILQSHAQTGRVVQSLASTPSAPAEQGDPPVIVGQHVDQFQIEAALRELDHIEQKREDSVAATMYARESPASPGKVPDGIVGHSPLNRRQVALGKRGEKVADHRDVRVCGHDFIALLA